MNPTSTPLPPPRGLTAAVVRLSGLSRPTVAKALKNSESVSESARRRVTQAVAKFRRQQAAAPAKLSTLLASLRP